MELEYFLPSSPSLPSQPTSTTNVDDRAVAQIYKYLTDFSGFQNTISDSNNTDGNTSVDFNLSDYEQSTTVNPANTDSVVYEEPLVSHLTQKQIAPVDESKIELMRIKYSPRSKFRPRMEKESEDASHYIRCEDHIPSKYPVLYICRLWATCLNIIQVTLVGIDREPHPYALENKERKTSQLVFKQDELNTLYFHVTDKDYEAGEKMFMMEYIKSKQDNVITKALIKNRQLHQSMLRFKRFYQVANGTYVADEDSTVYSCVMTEDYGKITIVDLFPLYGPMAGNQKVCVELKGHLPKDWKTKLVIHINANEINWTDQITNIKKNGKHITFYMPRFPYHGFDRARVNILIQYEKESVYQASYIYSRKIDDEMVGSTPLLSQPPLQIPDGHTGVKRPRQ